MSGEPGESDRKVMVCPEFKELCVGGRTKSFDKFKDERTGEIPQCRFWLHVSGKNPQGEQTLDRGDCCHPWSVYFQMEANQRTVGVAASVQTLTSIVQAGQAVLDPEVVAAQVLAQRILVEAKRRRGLDVDPKQGQPAIPQSTI